MNINRIETIRSQIRSIKYLVSDDIKGLSTIELIIVYNDILKVNDILLNKLMIIQKEYEKEILIKDSVIDQIIAFYDKR